MPSKFPRVASSFRTAVLAALAAGGLALAAAAQPAGAGLSAAERAAMVEVLGQRAEGLDEANLSAAVVRHAEIELGQRVRPSAIDEMWSIEPPRRDPAAELAAARAAGRLDDWLRSLPPPFPEYRALQEAERRYAGLAETGGWTPLPAGPTLRAGVVSPQVRLLRVRLLAEGYGVGGAGRTEAFDPAVREAVKAFQARHALPPDGVVGPATRAALNVSAEARLAQIRANLERWRWTPRRLPDARMEIDIGGQQGVFLRDGRPVLQMKVVVGDVRHHTPMFASRLEAVVFNPPWNVPPSIATKEILPKAARDPGYLARNDFTYVDGRLTQRPGPKNSLGRLKFDLPSPFGVYLHDTPVKSAFGRANRALSHGCMRLEKPQALAALLLGDQGWTAADIEAAIAAGKTRRVDLKTEVPLYVFYWTVVPDPAGGVDFRPDVYGWDAKLSDALAAQARTQRAALPRMATDCVEARG